MPISKTILAVSLQPGHEQEEPAQFPGIRIYAYLLPDWQTHPIKCTFLPQKISPADQDGFPRYDLRIFLDTRDCSA